MLRTWPLALLTTAVLALTALVALACADEEEAFEPAPTETPAATPVASWTTTPAVTPITSPTVAAEDTCPQASPSVVMTMTGPEQAHLGEQVIYTLSYDNVTAQTVDIRFEFTDLEFMSAQRVSGAGATGPKDAGTSADGRVLDFAWGSGPGAGVLEFTLQVRQDVTGNFVGGHTWLVGTCVAGGSFARTAIVPQ